ncbi:hypothetical protein ABL840_20750 [Variovorax sp. NFACC27]|uniref:hypothetical protein n=1 Tax=Variovorax TaxID=34072 RepID=UPI0008973A9D|nr:hypothetical protein [Variovorax paradoxus]SEF33680.1 hypothetical protein SAMN03159371_06695 [Variovorax sp. NFACC28]SEG96518.1 hypothetical protein SAMN03159365_06581 [Variovorax sp. NFACC29]SEM43721.1 hypothetical protein SAMN05518845_12553 [Variovorax sp. YR750]SFD97922.1 hypothetical protein SAMN03159379_06958 [Variovorax sp. NFACC26]SFH14762.1 hypothetical protein SAMN03159447_06904 [Variovorax sp. NFACC27]
MLEISMFLNGFTKHMRTAAVPVFALMVATSATAGVSWSFGISVPAPAVVAPAPIFYEPTPAYVVPAPSYYPPPVLLRPAPPVYYRPAPPAYPSPITSLRVEHNSYHSNHYHYHDWYDDD